MQERLSPYFWVFLSSHCFVSINSSSTHLAPPPPHHHHKKGIWPCCNSRGCGPHVTEKVKVASAECLLTKTNDEEFVAKSPAQLRLQKFFFFFYQATFFYVTLYLNFHCGQNNKPNQLSCLGSVCTIWRHYQKWHHMYKYMALSLSNGWRCWSVDEPWIRGHLSSSLVTPWGRSLLEMTGTLVKMRSGTNQSPILFS